MNKCNSLIFLFSTLLALPLYAEMDHATTHQGHEQHATDVMQQQHTQDHSLQHDEHGSSHNDHGNHQSMTKESQHDHDGMHGTQPAAGSKPAITMRLSRLDALPPSGKSREANFDNSYFMHNTALEQPLEVKCALASRGLIMLDNDSFQKCGGKPTGWSKGITAVQMSKEHHQHMNH